MRRIRKAKKLKLVRVKVDGREMLMTERAYRRLKGR